MAPIIETIATATVDLCKGSYLRKANNTDIPGPAIKCDLAEGDTIYNGSSLESCRIDTQDGATVEIKPSSRVKMIANNKCGFDIQVDVGSASMTRPASPNRVKLLRSSAVATAALGSNYTWRQTSGGDNTVTCDAGTRVKLESETHGWTVDIPADNHADFRDTDAAAPAPVQNAAATGGDG